MTSRAKQPWVISTLGAWLQIIRRESYRLQCPSEANDRLSAVRPHRYSEKLQSFQPEIRRRSLHHPAESILVALAYFEPKYLVAA
jgi:hypothetical protein